MQSALPPIALHRLLTRTLYCASQIWHWLGVVSVTQFKQVLCIFYFKPGEWDQWWLWQKVDSFHLKSLNKGTVLTDVISYCREAEKPGILLSCLWWCTFHLKAAQTNFKGSLNLMAVALLLAVWLWCITFCGAVVGITPFCHGTPYLYVLGFQKWK